MTRSIRLNDIQLILLATAAQRVDGSLLPPPDTLGDGAASIRKAVRSLIRRGLAVEIDLAAGADAWRTDGDRTIGVVITDAGRAAIAVDVNNGATEAGGVEVPSAPIAAIEVAVAPSLARTKTAAVLDLIRRDAGATLDEPVAATGWLPHTTRAALTGLRKKGHAITRGKRGDATCYTLGMEVAA